MEVEVRHRLSEGTKIMGGLVEEAETGLSIVAKVWMLKAVVPRVLYCSDMYVLSAR